MGTQQAYEALFKVIQESQERLREMRESMRKEFHQGLPTFVLPEDQELNWWGSLSQVVHVQSDGTLSVPRKMAPPSIQSGYDSKYHKAGTKFKVVMSWKTSKKTQGTHYILTPLRWTPFSRITHFYG